MFFPGLHIIDKNQQIQDPEELDKRNQNRRPQDFRERPLTQNNSGPENYDTKKNETLPESILNDPDKPL